METYYIKQGRNIPIKGKADKKILDLPMPETVAIKPIDFRGLKGRLQVQVGDEVKIGSPLVRDKICEDIIVVSPAAGTVVEIKRGHRRRLEEIIIKTNQTKDAVSFDPIKNSNHLTSLTRDEIIERLLTSGLWPFVRQRPFSKIANPSDTPKSIFVQAINTEPLSVDIDFVLNGSEEAFQLGLDVLNKLTPGDVHLCFSKQATSKTLLDADNVKKHAFSGPHPAGNVSTHIHRIDPIKKGDIVWYLSAQDVLNIGASFIRGSFCADRIVAVTGEDIKNRAYFKTIIGVSVKALIGEDGHESGYRYLSGSVLSGASILKTGFLSFYHTQIHALPEVRGRRFLGWLTPGFNSFSFTRMFLSSLTQKLDVSIDADVNGSERTIVLNNIYDKYVPLDILTYFLIRAIYAGDIEEAEALGILECDEEDFALCTFACPSKTDVGGIIRQGLDVIEREG